MARSSSGEERAAAGLHVEHQAVESLGQLLGHDAGGDERDRLDRAGDVAQRVEPLVGRRDLGRLPQHGAAEPVDLGPRLRSERLVRNPGMDSSLSSVPPVWPSPRPDIIGTATPQLATIGASSSETLSPTPPVECLSTTGMASPSNRSRSPESIIASVSAASSAGSSPRKYTAMSSAEIW